MDEIKGKEEKTHFDRLKVSDDLLDSLKLASKDHGLNVVYIVRKALFWWNKTFGKNTKVVYSEGYKDTTESVNENRSVLHPNIPISAMEGKTAADLRYIVTQYLVKKWAAPAKQRYYLDDSFEYGLNYEFWKAKKEAL